MYKLYICGLIQMYSLYIFAPCQVQKLDEEGIFGVLPFNLVGCQIEGYHLNCLIEMVQTVPFIPREGQALPGIFGHTKKQVP